MNVLEDIYRTNKDIVPKAIGLMFKNWTIIFAGLIYSIVLLLLWRIAFMFWILAGILITLVQSALISNYLYLIENIIRHGKISVGDFKAGFMIYIWKVYGVMVVIWFVNYGADLFLRPILNIPFGFITVGLLLQLAAFILLNCLPEVLYQKHYGVGESFSYSFDFIKENWLDWFLPNLILGVLIYFVFGKSLFLNQLSVLLFFPYITGQLLVTFMMIYRGLLFNILSTTTRRKRMFMRNVYR